MRIAIATNENHIALRFDCADQLIIAEVELEEGKASIVETREFQTSHPLAKAVEVAELPVEAVICGGIDRASYWLLEASEKQVIAWQEGCWEEVVKEVYCKLSKTRCKRV